MNLVFEKLSQTLSAGQKWPVGVAGNFFRLAVAAYPVSVSLISRDRIIGTVQNMLAGDYVRDIEFDGVIITNGATAQPVSFQIAGGGAGSDRVLGEVSVINGEDARVKSGACFVGCAQCAAVAGQYSHCQLWNPNGSGKNLFLNKLSLSYAVAGGLGMQRAVASIGATVTSVTNKRLTGAAPSAEVRQGAFATIQGSQAIMSMYSPSTLANVDYEFSEPIMIVPSSGIILFGGQVNNALTTNLQWYEEAE